MATLDSLVYEAAALSPQGDALIYDDGKNVTSLTYGQLEVKARSLCEKLKSYGLKEEVIGVLLHPDVMMPVVLTAIMSIPAAFMPLDVHLPKAVVKSAQEQLNLRLIVTSPLLADGVIRKLEGLSSRIDKINDHNIVLIWIGDIRTSPSRWIHALAYVITTSGSTGSPKVVKVPHSCVIPNILHLRSLYKIDQDDVSILMSPLTFDPSIVEMFVALSVGAALLIVPEMVKMLPEKLVSIIHKHDVSVMQVTPSIFSSLGQKNLFSHLLGDDTRLRVVAFGGEQCPPPSTLLKWRSLRNKTTFINLYGITEVSSWASYFLFNDDAWREDEVPLGVALDKTTLEVRDDTGLAITSGDGHLFVGGMERICLIDDETKAPEDGFRSTGDKVYVDPTRGLFYRGRTDRQIKRHGKRLNLDSLEQVVSQNPDILTCAAVLACDSGLHLFMKVSRRLDDLEKESLLTAMRQYILDHLPLQYLPDDTHLVRNIPYTRHGKVDRNKLLKHVQIQEITMSSCEDFLRSAWKEYLSLGDDANIEFGANWLSAGGDSFSAVHLYNRLVDSFRSTPDELLDTILGGTFEDVLRLLKTVKEISDLKLEKNDQEKSRPSVGSSKRLHLEYENIQPSDFKVRKTEDIPKPSEHDYPILGETISKTCSCDNKYIALSRSSRYSSCCTSQVERNKIYINELSHSLGDETDKLQNLPNHKLKLTRIWAVNTGKCIDASPLILISSLHKMVFIGSHSHKFLAISLYSGETIWEQFLGDRIESSACISPCGQFVIVGCYDGNIYTMDIVTGDVVWTYATKGQVKCSPVSDMKFGLVLVGSHDQCVYALDIQKKQCRWRLNLNSGSVYSSPVISYCHLVVYFCTLGGTVAALGLETGQVMWRRTVGKPIFSSPCLFPGGVTLGCVGGKIHSFNHLGEPIWTFETSGPIFSSPTYSGPDSSNKDNGLGSIIFGCHDNVLYSVDTNGCLLWKYKTDAPIFSSPLLLDSIGTAGFSSTGIMPCQFTDVKYHISTLPSAEAHVKQKYIACNITTGHIVIVDSTTGQYICDYKFPGETFSSPVAYENKIFIGCRDDNIYCLQVMQG